MTIANKIITIRDTQVLLDRDLAELYDVEVKYLKRQVRRNSKRFPKTFLFQLNDREFASWRSHFVTSKSDKKGLRHAPYAFTEQGVSMLAGILKSNTAIEISIKIIEEFVRMRHMLQDNILISSKFQQIDQKFIEQDSKFNELFSALQPKKLPCNQGVFFEGSVFDAHKLITDILKKAKENIILVDNYIDEDTLTLFSDTECSVIIYTKNISKKLQLAYNKYSVQYGNITIKEFTKSHDRFLLIDSKIGYHLGASLKDLGKKWFACNKLEDVSLIWDRLPKE